MKRTAFILFLIVIGSALVFAGGSKESENMDKKPMEKKTESGPAMQGPAMQGPAMKGPAMQGPAMTAPAVGGMSRKTDFTDLASAQKLAEKGPAVLFFSASWCPTCRTANKDIDENGAALGKDISVIVVDYDTYPDLKKKYGITYQHTFVQIDAKGEAVKKWSGGGVDEINKNVMKMM